MNMISAQVRQIASAVWIEANSHDSTLSHGIIKLRLCFFVYFECAPFSGENYILCL